MEVKGIICDFDGVNRKVLPIGIVVYLKALWRLGFWRILELLEFILYLAFEEFLAYFALFLSARKLSNPKTHRRDRITGSIETLEYLKEAGYKIGLVTNRKWNILDWHARRLGLNLNLFDSIVTRDGPFKKPNPRVFDKILEKWRYSSGQVLYVGDRYDLDYLVARQRGLDCVVVCSSYTTHKDFLRLGVPEEKIINSLLELPGYLGRCLN